MGPITDFPKGVRNSTSGDYVSYVTFDKEGKEGRKESNAACYSTPLGQVKIVGIRTESRQPEGTRLSGELYLQWMDLCKQHKLFAQETEVFVENGKNVLVIQPNQFCRPATYIPLVCFRWADSSAQMVWQILEHMEKRSGFTFWQALHYSLGTLCKFGTGHSFTMINMSGSVYCGHATTNMAYSVALKKYFESSQEERAAWHKNDMYVNNATKKIADELSDPPKNPDRYTTCTANLVCPALAELIGDKWTPLYELENPTRDRLKELYEEISNDAGKET